MASRRHFLRHTGMLGFAPFLPAIHKSSPVLDQVDYASTSDDVLFSLIRGQLLLPSDRIYLNTGSLGPSPVEILDLVYTSMRSIEMNPAIENWGELGRQMEMVREITAKFINANSEEILLTRNTTEGLSLVAQSIRLESGDEILTTDQEHGGALSGLEYTAANQGATIHKLSFPMPTSSAEEIVEIIRTHVNDRTKLILLSHVNTITGLVMPFEKISQLTRPRGIILVADGAQAPGQLEIDVKAMGVDAYATSGHKWLLGPKETGFLYVSPDSQVTIHSAFTHSGFGSYSASSGTRNVATMIGMGAVMQWHREIGINRIQRRCREIRNYCYDHLVGLPGIKIISPKEDALSCGIVSFTLDEVKNTEVAKKLREQDVIIKVLAGLNGNRISCHMFVSKEDIDRFVHSLQEII